ncbi:hypothetical protein GF324_00430 [bacterium]|nr:hypothetical protein [bacterium]
MQKQLDKGFRLDWSLVGALLLAVIIGLDSSAAFMTLVGQPVVTGILVGALSGHIEAGMTAGLLMQLLWLDASPLGGKLPPDPGPSGFAAAMAAAGAAAGTDGFAWAGFPLAYGMLWGTIAAYGTMLLPNLIRRFHDRLLPLFDLALEAGDRGTLKRLFYMGLLSNGFYGIIAGWLPGAAALLLWPWVSSIPLLVQHANASLAVGTLLVLGGWGLARLYAGGSRWIAFTAPIAATLLYLAFAGRLSGVNG